jgi:hypothetical protein
MRMHVSDGTTGIDLRTAGLRPCDSIRHFSKLFRVENKRIKTAQSLSRLSAMLPAAQPALFLLEKNWQKTNPTRMMGFVSTVKAHSRTLFNLVNKRNKLITCLGSSEPAWLSGRE